MLRKMNIWKKGRQVVYCNIGEYAELRRSPKKLHGKVIQSIMNDPMISTHIKLDVPTNTRDLGGMAAADGGKIVSGKLIRSGNLFGATEADLLRLSGLVGTVVDLRSDKEREEKPDPVIPGAESIWLPVFEKREGGVERDKDSEKRAIDVAAKDPEMAKEKMLGAYRSFVSKEYSVGQYRRLLNMALEPGDKALLWHCTAGKDRTGFGALIIQTLLGVHIDDIYADYLITNEYIKGEVEWLYGMFEKKLGGLDETSQKALFYLFGAHLDYLEEVFNTAEELYGSFDGFLTKGLGMGPEERKKLQDIYLR